LDENENYTTTVIWCVSKTFKQRMFNVPNYSTPVRTSNGSSVYTAAREKFQGPDLQNMLRQSYDNAKVTIDLRRTSNLRNILLRTQGFSSV